jgi:hypothetical protein
MWDSMVRPDYSSELIADGANMNSVNRHDDAARSDSIAEKEREEGEWAGALALAKFDEGDGGEKGEENDGQVGQLRTHKNPIKQRTWPMTAKLANFFVNRI